VLIISHNKYSKKQFFLVSLYYIFLIDIIYVPYVIQGISIINAIINGNNIVQQKDINWSNRILGKEALTHIKVNIKAETFNPNEVLPIKACIIKLS
jgi:hypothetical protein